MPMIRRVTHAAACLAVLLVLTPPSYTGLEGWMAEKIRIDLDDEEMMAGWFSSRVGYGSRPSGWRSRRAAARSSRSGRRLFSKRKLSGRSPESSG